MAFLFETDRAIQAAAVLLRAEPSRRMGKLRLLQVLYIADREVLSETGRSLLGGRVVAMRHGPRHANVYELIHGSHADEPKWARHFQRVGRMVVLTDDPGVMRLSKYEIDKLNTVSDRLAATDDYDVAELTHQFAEWVKNYSNAAADISPAIPLADVIDAVGRGADKSALLQDASDEAAFTKLFAEPEHAAR